VSAVKPGQAAKAAWMACPQGGDPDAPWEAAAKAAITAGGWEALKAEFAGLAPADALVGGGSVLAGLAFEMLARLGLKPEGKAEVTFEADEAVTVTIRWPQGTAPDYGERVADHPDDCRCVGCEDARRDARAEDAEDEEFLHDAATLDSDFGDDL
jgi:hypothetical protein